MELDLFARRPEYEWEIVPRGRMRVPAVIYASEQLIRDMDHKVYEQAVNVAMLPGIVKASYAMPDAHWGYGFTIGGVAAFDPERGGVVSAGGVSFDISCGVRCLLTGMKTSEVVPRQELLADLLFSRIPARVGSTSDIHLDAREMQSMLAGSAKWVVARGYGGRADLERIEEGSEVMGAQPEARAFLADQVGGNPLTVISSSPARARDVSCRAPTRARRRTPCRPALSRAAPPLVRTAVSTPGLSIRAISIIYCERIVSGIPSEHKHPCPRDTCAWTRTTGSDASPNTAGISRSRSSSTTSWHCFRSIPRHWPVTDALCASIEPRTIRPTPNCWSTWCPATAFLATSRWRVAKKAVANKLARGG
jgi:hypothetical protein